MDLTIKAGLAGVLFGIWPILMNKSGLSGFNSSLVFALLLLVTILPFALYNGVTFASANWMWYIPAGLIAGAGIILFNSMVAGATTKQIGLLFVINILIQMLIPAIYQVIQNGGVSITKGIGFVLALAASVLLII